MSEKSMEYHNFELQERQFYIQLVDENSFIAVDEFFLGFFSIEEMANRIGCKSDNLKPGGFFFIDNDLKLRVEKIFDLNLNISSCEIIMISWSPFDGLPYRTHSGREFILMRDRKKPLSVFTSMIPSPPDSLDLPKDLFMPLLISGKVVSKNYCEIINGDNGFVGLEVVLYAEASESWRIEAYVLLRATAKKLGWPEPLIRMEGALLGYSDWQNDAFIAVGCS